MRIARANNIAGAAALLLGVMLVVAASSAAEPAEKSPAATTAAPGSQPSTQKAQQGYAVTREESVAGDGSWDNWSAQPVTLDDAGKLLYIPRGNRTQVVDVETGKVVAEIPGVEVRGVALAPEFGRGFVTNFRDDSVTVFSLKDYSVLAKIPLDDNPTSVIYDEVSKKVLVGCDSTSSLAVIAGNVDVKAPKPEATISLDGGPQGLVSDGQGTVYVAMYDKDEIAVVDTRTLSVATNWSVPDWYRPMGIAMDRERGRIFVGCRSRVEILSAADGRELGTVEVATQDKWVGKGALAFVHGKALASAGEGTVAVITSSPEGKFTLESKIAVPPGCWGMGVNEKTGTLYFPHQDNTPTGRKRRNGPALKLTVVEKN